MSNKTTSKPHRPPAPDLNEMIAWMENAVFTLRRMKYYDEDECERTIAVPRAILAELKRVKVRKVLHNG